MDVLLLGTLISDSTRDFYKNNHISPQPADVAQKYIVSGLSQNRRVDRLFSICSPRIPSSLSCPIRQVEDEDFIINRAVVHVVGYLNTPIISFALRERLFVDYCKKWAKSIQSNELIILIYSLNSTMLKAARRIRSIIPNTSVCVIVADLPVYMSSYKGVKGLLKHINTSQIDRERKKIVDKYVLYSSHMAKYLKLTDDNWITVEGFFDPKRVVIKKPNSEHSQKYICVYGGSLSAQYGIQRMINAFSMVQGCELHIYGNEDEAKAYSYNENAKYICQLTPEEVFSVYCHSDFLINPRPSSLALSKYSFPSKTFEYMASCTPVVMSELPCVTKRFKKYLNFFVSESEEGIAQTMNSLLSIPYSELQQKAMDGAEFIKNEMNAKKQVERILFFVSASSSSHSDSNNVS